jgi:hypothetical protein
MAVRILIAEYLKGVAIGLDQLANTLIFGPPDETISARAWREKDRSRAWRFLRWLIDHLLWFDRDHCQRSYESEEHGAQNAPEYRENQ